MQEASWKISSKSTVSQHQAYLLCNVLMSSLLEEHGRLPSSQRCLRKDHAYSQTRQVVYPGRSEPQRRPHRDRSYRQGSLGYITTHATNDQMLS